MGFGLINAIGGAGEAVANTANTYYKDQLDTDKQKALQEAMLTRLQSLEVFKEKLKNEPLNQFGQAVAGRVGTPVSVAPATSLTGDELADHPGAFSGDIASLRKQITSAKDLSDEDRNAALAQLDAQEAAANQKQSGQTRPLTRAEAESAAISDLASQGNYQAIVAGKAAMGDKFVKVAGDDTLIDPTTGKVVFRNTAASDRRIAEQDRLDARQSARDDRRDDRLEKILDARTTSPLTKSQQLRNYEVDAARKYVEGMSDEEIQRKTQQYSATGRENKDYDPQLATRAKLAGRRKYGDDPWFDQKFGLDGDAAPTPQPVPLPGGNDTASRFQADPAMRGLKLGKETPKGTEVLDTSGRLRGYYQ